VGVVPIDTRVRKGEAVRETTTDGNRSLRGDRPVVPILQTQPVPVYGRLEIAVIGDMDEQLGALADAQL
jgi:hypothetical protein